MPQFFIKKRPENFGGVDMKLCSDNDLSVIFGWTVNEHPYQPYQCGNTNNRIYDIAGQCGGAK